MIVLKMRKTTTCRGLSRLSSTLKTKNRKEDNFLLFLSIFIIKSESKPRSVYYVKILVLDTKILIQMLSEQQLVLLTYKKN